LLHVLTSLATPGGIAISDDAYRQIRNHSQVSWVDCGLHLLKNIRNPIQVWHWHTDNFHPETGAVPPETYQALKSLKPTISVQRFSENSTDSTSVPIAEALCDGIITDLAKFREFSVIAASSFAQHGPEKVTLNALEVDYFLTGTQQNNGQKMRISAKLQLAATGEIIWAKVFDRNLGDLFSVQDELAKAVATRVGAVIAFQPSRSHDSGSSRSQQHYLLARKEFRKYTCEGNLEALRLNTLAVEQDPDSAFGYIGLCFVYAQGYLYGWIDVDRPEAMRIANEFSRKALELEPDNYDSHFANGWMHSAFGQHDDAVRSYQKAIALNPSAENAVANLAEAHVYSGHYEEAIRLFRDVMNVDPMHPQWWHHGLAWAQWFSGDIMDALSSALQTSERTPEVCLKLAAIYQTLGESGKAAAQISRALSKDNDLSVSRLGRESRHRFVDKVAYERWLSAHSSAGLPE
jgi:TolB-like protein